jgi:ribosomal protein S18 acetylase RimI-like enzyme
MQIRKAQASDGPAILEIILPVIREGARERGYRAMQFNFVVSTNERAVRLWQSLGFAIVGRLPGAFRHPAHGYVDALVMYQSL